jgi:hypothetical protein
VGQLDNLLAVAAMHNGFHVVDASTCEVIASYTEEHKSLAYGVDLKDSSGQFQDSEEVPTDVWIGSCSFYDHTFKLWKLNF